MSDVIINRPNARARATFAEINSTSPLFFPVTTRALAGVNSKTGLADLPIDGHFGVYRKGPNGEPINLGVVGASYNLEPFKNLVEEAENVMLRDLTPAQLEGVEVKDTMSYNGGRVWREYILPAFKGLVTTKNKPSTIGYRTVIGTSYDGSSSHSILSGLIDFYCTNGMWAGDLIEQGRRRHTRGANMALFANILATGIEGLQEHVERLQSWSDTDVSRDNVVDFFEAVSSERRARGLIEQFDVEVQARGATAWAAYSAMTFYASHNDVDFPVRETGNDNVAATLYGREAEVSRWVGTKAWGELLAA